MGGPGGSWTAPPVDPALVGRLRNGANWFHWIAGFTLVNGALAFFGSSTSFSFGLQTSLLAHAFAGRIDSGIVGRAMAGVFDLCACGMLVLFGVLARRGMAAIFWIGTALYALDSLWVLAYMASGSGGGIVSALFRCWALFGMVTGAVALAKLKKAGWQP